MKQYIYAFIFLIMAAACVRIEESEVVSSQGEKVSMQLTAYIDAEEVQTKTFIDGEPVASVRNTFWLPDDAIAVMGGLSMECFTNTINQKSAVATFDGVIEEADLYYALYPYSSYMKSSLGIGHSFEKGILYLNIPEVQKYEPNTFATDMVPMVTVFSAGKSLNFKNVCGGIVFKLSGNEKIVSARFDAYDKSGSDAQISGCFSVNMKSEQFDITPMTEAVTGIMLDCGDGVQLHSDTPTAFHFVVAPALYKGFKATFVADNGKCMVIESEKDLNIRRSNITYVSAQKFENNIEPVDLSLSGTANCYIVSGLGSYSFDATTIGNGRYGIVPGADFHTDDPVISPVSVQVLWQDQEEDVLKNVKLNDGRISFMTTGIEGNALVAVMNGSGTILWSWHIWVTDKPKDQVYVNNEGTFTVLDRNLGALRADRGTGDDWKDSMGTLYFWGRKDPFYSPEVFQKGRETMTIEESIVFPTMIHSVGSWVGGRSSWMVTPNKYAWHESKKTIYDPCPVGYRVPTDAIWAGFSTLGVSTKKLDQFNIAGGFDNGFNFYINPEKLETAWYPLTHFIQWTGDYKEVSTDIYNWSSSYSENTDKYKFHVNYVSDWNTELSLYSMQSDAHANPVRCIKDDGYIDVSLPQIETLGCDTITSSSAVIVADITATGATNVVERGFLWGKTQDLSDGVKIKCGTGAGRYTCNLEGLEPSTKYYVKAYAVNSRGENYGEILSFVTVYADGVVNLSKNGTSNCYVVSDSNLEYAFDCTVKGNSLESIGSPSSVEVLWETEGCSGTADKGTIISDVEIKGNLVAFRLAENLKEGNAFIAVKDDSGTILWSWHIWVSDLPKEQIYQNRAGSFAVLDRNIGATRPDKGTGEEWKDSRGLAYFWGRKDPFWYDNYIHGAETLTSDYVVANPTTRHNTSHWASNKSSWMKEYDTERWSVDTKTINDPCPVGYRLAINDIWRGFTTSGATTDNVREFNVKESFDKGYEFYINDNKTETAWYPASYYMGWHSGHKEDSYNGFVWCANSSKETTNKCALEYSDSRIWVNHYNKEDGYGLPVRCMREK